MSLLRWVLAALLLASPALGQTPGTLNLSGPSTGGQVITPATINAGVNSQLGLKADATNPVITGNLTVGGTITGAGGSFLPLVGGALTGDLTTSGRILSSTGTNLRFTANGANGFTFQNGGGGNSLLINGNASAIANQITIVPQVTGNGPAIVATGTDTNIALKLQSKGTGAVQVNVSPFAVTPSALTFTGGVTPTSSFSYTASSSGTINTASPNPIVYFQDLGDTITKTSTAGFFPFFAIIKNWGGGSQQGHQQAFRVNMVQTAAVSGNTPPVDMQMGAAGIFADYAWNVGGTSTAVGSAVGAAYTLIPAIWLHAGATNYTIASNAEWDITVDATQQKLTLGGTITATDTVSVTYTAASIVGSPVTVVATAGTGDVLQSLVNKIVAAVNNNAALANAGVSAAPDTLSNIVDLFTQTQNATSISVAVGGSATETAVLGAVVPGASTKDRINNSFASRGAGRAALNDSILDFGSLNATPGSSANSMISLGSVSSAFAIAPGGALLSVRLQNGVSNLGANQPLWSPQLARGFDLRLINWTQYAGSPFLSPGFNVSGTGSLNLQNAVISVTSTGLVLDVPSGRIGTGNPAIVSGGGGGAGVTTNNYYVGDIVQGVNGTDTNGGQYLVASVNQSTGAVTGLTTLVQPSTTTTSLGTAIATIGGSGTGLTITPTAATNTGISLAPSGGATTVGGSLAVTGALTAPSPTFTGTVGAAAVTASGLVSAQLGLNVGTVSSAQLLQINGPAASNRILSWLTANSRRWQFFTNGSAEGGSNAGSDFQISAFDDTGTLLFTPLTIKRSTGTITLGGLIKLSAFTVATLPAAATAGVGALAYVTDATAPTYRGTLTGGGAVITPVFSDGTAWTSH